eukprot:TRINITY_DN4851_c0_g1_i1.p1 TRINITY_DN4851_c0_g1~~TRINITY_DN4851_c0_g1_i1.p1  ORF type:complete len:287 (-),score=79.11 TRINITY_DN4851_c0_g1_i1:387-1247(-)
MDPFLSYLLALIAVLDQCVSGSPLLTLSPLVVLSGCLESPPNASSYIELTANKHQDIRTLSSLRCRHNDDTCLSERTGLYCRQFSSGGFCDCPLGHAYDPRICGCRQAEPCRGGPYCHNEMRCPNRRCSCQGGALGENVLFEPHGRLCVLPREESSEADFEAYFHPGSTSSLSGASIGLLIASSLVLLLILSAITFRYIRRGSLTCKKGDYDCEDDPLPGGGSGPLRRNDEVHVAAWDLPSMDYLTEEEAALKYISKERVCPDEGSSLPECEQSHINAGYISDNHY